MEEKKENFLKRVSKRFGNLLVLVITPYFPEKFRLKEFQLK